MMRVLQKHKSITWTKRMDFLGAYLLTFQVRAYMISSLTFRYFGSDLWHLETLTATQNCISYVAHGEIKITISHTDIGWLTFRKNVRSSKAYKNIYLYSRCISLLLVRGSTVLISGGSRVWWQMERLQFSTYFILLGSTKWEIWTGKPASQWHILY